jgi:uncharacterized membrane protein YgaE (UPF0421/DUF939 family)
MRRADAGPIMRERAAPLLEDAADRSRVSLRTRWARVRVAWRSLVQASLASGAAWVLATELLGHKRPFFAPVAAIITLGLTVTERGRRAFELAIGVPLGIAIADLLVLGIGTGPIQLSVVVLLAYALGLFVGRQLLASQAAVSAALVATLQPPGHGITFSRAVDALVGGSVALIVNGLVLPAHPRRMLRSAAEPVLEELAATLEDVAHAIESRDRSAAESALERARAIDELEERFEDAIRSSRETTRYAPPRRRSRGHVESYAGAAGQIDLAVRNVRVLARGAIRGIRLDENVPDDVADAVRDLAAAVRALGPSLDDEIGPGEVRDAALRAAGRASAVLERTGNLSVSVIVGQIRSTATDLIVGATGVGPDDAAEAVRVAGREAALAAARAQSVESS